MKTTQYLMHSKIGPLYLLASDLGLRGVFWKPQDSAFVKSISGGGLQIQFLAQAVQELKEYFESQRTVFEIPLDIIGTSFQMQVWEQLRGIPYGQTCSYSEIAARIGNPKAVRAVGTANGRNPLSVIVPCHRVIAAGGTLGGYAGGLPIKSILLELEQRKIQQESV